MKFFNDKISDNSYLLTRQGSNNFDFLRFFLAVLVIFSHCYVIYYGKLQDTEPAMILTRNQTDFGGIAVDFFFIISGFLILQSFFRSETAGIYFKKRFLRIYPGYFVAFLISILIVGPLGTAWDLSWTSVHYYFETISKKHLLLNLVTLQKPVGGRSFAWLPLPGMLNESLWTIEYEFFCYLLLPVILLKRLGKSKASVVILLGLMYVITIIQHFYPQLITERRFPVSLLYVIDPVILPRFIVYFLTGSCFYLFREKIVRSVWIVVVSVIAIVLSCSAFKVLELVLPFAGAYLLFFIAYHPRIKLSSFAQKGDLSYGMYLYAWPIQQLLAYALYKHIGPLTLFCLSVPLTYLAALMSWHYVEKVFLRLKTPTAEERAPLQVPQTE